jgi:hypothetical protein
MKALRNYCANIAQRMHNRCKKATKSALFYPLPLLLGPVHCEKGREVSVRGIVLLVAFPLSDTIG